MRQGKFFVETIPISAPTYFLQHHSCIGKNFEYKIIIQTTNYKIRNRNSKTQFKYILFK